MRQECLLMQVRRIQLHGRMFLDIAKPLNWGKEFEDLQNVVSHLEQRSICDALYRANLIF